MTSKFVAIKQCKGQKFPFFLEKLKVKSNMGVRLSAFSHWSNVI